MVKRKIAKRESFVFDHTPRGGYTVHYVLECGHEQWRKGSKESKNNWVYCKECSHD